MTRTVKFSVVCQVQSFVHINTKYKLAQEGNFREANLCHYYSPLMNFMDHAVNQQFVEAEHREMLLLDENPAGLLDQFARYQPPTVDKAKWALQMMNEKR